MPADLKTKISYTLPEGRDIRLNAQGLVPDSDDKTNIRFAEDADVWVTFLSEGAGYRNSVGYFSYDPANPPKGCYFHPRCRYVQDVCKLQTPEFRELKPDHFVACHRAEELTLEGI